jgi:hypothetical protein
MKKMKTCFIIRYTLSMTYLLLYFFHKMNGQTWCLKVNKYLCILIELVWTTNSWPQWTIYVSPTLDIEIQMMVLRAHLYGSVDDRFRTPLNGRKTQDFCRIQSSGSAWPFDTQDLFLSNHLKFLWNAFVGRSLEENKKRSAEWGHVWIRYSFFKNGF